jgi:hypothetical protein
MRHHGNDGHAASRFAAAIDDIGTGYCLRGGSALSSTPGSGPRTAVDRYLDGKISCSAAGGRPFTPFATWSTTLP